jgi:preprotein translocase subunit SecA
VNTAYVDCATAEVYDEDWDLDQLWTALKQLYQVGIEYKDLTHRHEEMDDLTREDLLDALLEDANNAYERREAELEELAGEDAMRQLERNVLLNVLDRKWREHLYEMDYLKEGIGLRAMAQRDPLVEYQREGYDMFIGMLEGLKEESVGFLFNVTVEAAPPPAVAPTAAPEGLAEFAAAAATKAQGQQAEQGAVATKEREVAPAALRAKGIDDGEQQLTYSGPSEDGSAKVQRRNGDEPAPAGVSGTTRRERREAARKQAKAAKSSRRR